MKQERNVFIQGVATRIIVVTIENEVSDSALDPVDNQIGNYCN